MKTTRRLISGLSALTLAGLMTMTAFAQAEPSTINEKSDPQSAQAEITTEIAPAYVVTIPADTTVKFNDTVTDFGTVELTQARLDPGKQVVVSVDTDGELNNEADAEKVIPYTVMAQYASGAEGEEYLPFKVSEQSLQMDTEGQKFAMTIEISEDDWNKAYAGSYSDTVTFNVQYTDPYSPEDELPEDFVDIEINFMFDDPETGDPVPYTGHRYVQFEAGKTWAETVLPGDDLRVENGSVIIYDEDHDVFLYVFEGTADNLGAAVSPDDPVDHSKSYIAVVSE